MTGKFMSFILAMCLFIANGVGQLFKIDTSGLPNLVKPAAETEFQPGNDWQLVFEDNFDGEQLDTTKWHYGYAEEGVRRGGYWVDDAVMVQDGNLIIRTNYREDGKFGPGWYTGTVETSKSTYKSPNGAVESPDFKGFSAQYGYFEVRCQVPRSVGIWSAFWLMPDSNFKTDVPGGGDDGAEIDIFESPFMYVPTYKQTVSHAVHIDGYGDELKSSGSRQQFVRNLYNEFHTFALEWNETEYIFYVDGMETWRNSKTVKEADVDADGNPYDTVAHCMEYMILSVEVGGSEIDGVVTPGKVLEDGEIVDHWSGNPEKNEKDQNYDFIVDYVKVYQKTK